MSTPSTLAPDAATTVFAIDPSHTDVRFAVRHMMIATVRGSFPEVQGMVRLNEANPSASSVSVNVNIASVNTRDAQRDAHLRSADFFDADRFPEMTFRSRRLDGTPDRPFTLVGDLTIRGVTREIALDVVPEGRAIDPWGNERFGFSAAGSISRADFGLTWNKLLETGGVAVGDEVKISLDVELIKQTAAV